MGATDRPVDWPEKVWLDTIHWNDQSKPPKFFGAQNTIVHVVEPVNSIEYVRADLAKPQFTPEQLQSVLDALEIGEIEVWRTNAQCSGCLDSEYVQIRAAIALLKGMK